MTFRDIIRNSEISEEEHEQLVYICSDWELFCKSLMKLDKLQTIKLLKYLIEERHSSQILLKRSIGRFNRLNRLTKEELILCWKE